MKTEATSGGIGVCGILLIIFITLKILGLTNISWLWVFSPLWLPILLFFGIMALVIVLTFVIGLIGAICRYLL